MENVRHLREKLRQHGRQALQLPLAQCLSADPRRAVRYRLRAGPLYIDYSRNRIDDAILALLIEYAEACRLSARITQLFAGAALNSTENQPALHWTWRAGAGQMVQAGLERLAQSAEAVRAGSLRGFSGRPLKHIVNIGIGGSDLGVRLLHDALSARYREDSLDVDFLSNLDPKDQQGVLEGSDPESTLFVICSKSFTTQETLCNAARARSWLQAAAGGRDSSGQFFAVTAAPSAAIEFGIRPEQVLVIQDGLVGRYSLWSPMSLAAVLALGFAPFRALLAGAEEMDQHFQSTPLAENAPVLLGLLDVWNHSFCGLHTQACIPYDQDLAMLPAYLAQLFMESNGKGVTHDGDAAWSSAPVVWGGVGSNSQHSFGQFLHQGLEVAGVDFLLPLGVRGGKERTGADDVRQHAALFAHCLAQAQVLMHGWQEQVAHKNLPGDRPSTLILYPHLDAGNLGRLLALYEHRCFVQAVLWNINPFDQWGVERGKRLAGDIERRLLDAGTGGGSLPADACAEENIALYLKACRGEGE